MIKDLKRARSDNGTFAEKYTADDINRIHELRSRGLTFSEISAKTGLTQTQVRYVIYYKHPSTQASTPHSSQSTTSTDGTVTQVGYRTLKAGLSKQTDSDVLKAHGLDPAKFTLTSVTDNYWGKDDEGEPLYQTKIKAEPKEYDLGQLIETVNEEVKPVKLNVEKTSTGTTALIIPLFDLHFGISTFETMKPFLDQIKDVLKQGFLHVLVILGGDYFHSDSITKSVTVKGTQLDHVDMVKALKDGDRFFDELMTSALTCSGDVSVISVPGNHDADVSYVWANAMKRKYGESTYVFDVESETWTAFNFGRCGFLIAHGDVAKNRLPMLFADQAKEIWSKTDFHGVFYGHFHKEITTDDYGCSVFQVGTPKPADAWEKRNGLVMSTRKMELFEFDESHLLSTRYIYPDYED